MTTRLCITADDYGLSVAGNEAIEDLAARGRLSAVSVMVHDGAELGGLDRLRAAGVALGLHLVLTHERALSGSRDGAGLVDAHGRLPRGWPRLFARLAARPRLHDAVRRELEAQRRRFASLDLPLAFVNSHEHVHLFPLVWAHVATLVSETPGVAVRSARGQLPYRARQLLVTLASQVSWKMRPLVGRLALSPLGVDDSGRIGIAQLPALLVAARAVRAPSLAELVVHPASEHAMLASPELPLLLARHDVVIERGDFA